MMQKASYQRSAYTPDRSLRRRGAALALALGVGALMLLALLRLGIFPDRMRKPEPPPLTFEMLPQAKTETAAAAKPAKPRATVKRAPPPPPAKLPPPVPPSPMPPNTIPNMIIVTRDEFAASDIGKIAPRAADSGTGTDGAAAGDSASAYGPGEGPGGQKLYSAQWYREPTRAEMAFYMPKDSRIGWGMIACQTIPRNRVENCRVLAESPGSGIGRGLREAAWQFQVLPPRVGGKPMIGAWVRIRFDLVRGVVK